MSVSKKTTTAAGKPRKKKAENVIPLMVSEASASPYQSNASSSDRTAMRRNVSGTIERSDKFGNIDKGLVPFRKTDNKGGLSVRDAVVLCQKAYYNFSVFRNAIDLMTEFSNARIYFRGGSKKSRRFFEALLKKVNIWDLQDQFFREYFRSGNVFLYRLDAALKPADVKKISQTFGAKKIKIPHRYVVLNPADIQLSGSLSFSSDVKKYHKVLTDYEIERIRSPRTEEDKKIRESLPDDVKKLLNSGNVLNSINIPLEEDKIYAIFYKKMDYEPFAVPMGYPVLEDINFKSELKRMDMAIARTMQQAVLLVTTGTDPDKGGVNQKNLIHLQKLFENQSVGRVLIADYTTKAQFVLPQIGDLLDPKKYQVINSDIQAGLNSMITGAGSGVSSDTGDKASSFSTKVEIFLARLNQARQTFLSDFLIPEVKRVAEEMKLKNYPTPLFDEISLRESTNLAKVYSRLVEVGILTPEEGLQAMETGRLPTPEESLISQKEFKAHKNQGLYEPIVGGPATQKELADKQGKLQKEMKDKDIKQADKAQKRMAQQGPPPGQPGQPVSQPRMDSRRVKQPAVKQPAGRPSGTDGIPQEKKRESKSLFSFNKIKDNMILFQGLEKKVEAHLRKIHKVKKLNKKQQEIATSVAEVIISNETPSDWGEAVSKYCEKPVDKNHDVVEEISEICLEHQVDSFMGSVLYHSKANEEDENEKNLEEN
jgi:hypothetical protein